MKHTPWRLTISVILLVAAAVSCRHPFTSPVDPDSVHYIGFTSGDADGDGVGSWTDVDEIVLQAPAEGTVLASAVPELSVTPLDPELVGRYHFQVATSSTFTREHLLYDNDNVQGPSLVVPTGLLANHGIYYWRVRAYDGNRWSETWSTVRSFSVQVQVSALSNLRVVGGEWDGSPQMVVTWQQNPDAKAHHIQLASSTDFSATLLEEQLDVADDYYAIQTELESGRQYYCRIRVQNHQGLWGQWTTPLAFAVHAHLPEPDGRLPGDQGSVAVSQPTLSWNQVTGAEAYHLEVSSTPGFAEGTFISMANLTDTSFRVVQNLMDGDTYYWRIRSRNASGVWTQWSDAWSFQAITDSPVLVEPSEAALLSEAYVELSWESHAAAYTYRLQVAADSDFTAIVHDDAVATGFTAAHVAVEDGATYFWRVFAVDETGAESSAADARSFSVDLSPPPAPQINGPQITNDRTPTWEFVPSQDTTGIRYQMDGTAPDSWVNVDGGGARTYSPPSALADGEHAVYVQARDAVGNWSDVATATTFVDATPPAAPVVSGQEKTSSEMPVWTWTLPADSSLVRYQVDGQSADGWQEAPGSTDRYQSDSPLDPGSHTLYVAVRDEAGNWSETDSYTTVIDFLYDQIPPPSGRLPSDDAFVVVPRPTLQWDAHVDVDSYEVQISDSSSFAGTPVYAAADLVAPTVSPDQDLDEGGRYYWRLRSRTTSGVWTDWSSVWRMRISATPVALDAPADTAMLNTPAPVLSWAENDTAHRYRVTVAETPDFADPILDAYTFDRQATEVYLQGLAETTYHWQVRAVDETGGEGGESVVRSFSVDTTPPETPVVSVPDQTTDSTPTWTWTVSADAVDVRYQLDGTDAGSWVQVGSVNVTSFTSADQLQNGPHTLYVQTRDAAGNWSEAGSGATLVDTHPPATPVVQGPAVTNDTTPTWTWSTGPDAALVRFQLNGTSPDAFTEAAPGQTSYTPDSPLSDGSYTLYVQSQDSAGNQSALGTFAVVVDTMAPAAPQVDGLATTWRTQPTWSFSGPADAVAMRYQLGGEAAGGWTTVSATGTQEFRPAAADHLAQGNHVLYVQAQDAAGNWSPSGQFATTVDSTTITLAWDPSPDADVEGYLVHQGETQGSYDHSMTAPAGESPTFVVAGLELGTEYFFAATAYNSAGLQSDYSNVVAFTPGIADDHQDFTP